MQTKFEETNEKPSLTKKLVKLITLGKQDQLEVLFKKNPELMVERITFQDKSERTFTNVSVWEYVLWSLDVCYMAPMMLRCLPLNEEGESLRLQLLDQYERVENGGLSYQLKGETYTEKHYNFAIINVLRVYVAKKEQEDRDKYWRNEVREQELLVTANVAQHICDPAQSFYPIPEFDQERFNRSLRFFNWMTRKSESWYSSLSKNSDNKSKFALFRGAEEGATPSLKGPKNPSVLADLNALEKLYERRIRDFEQLKQQLINPVYMPESLLLG